MGLDKIQTLAEWVLNLDSNKKKLLITIPTLVTTIGALTIVGSKVISTINLIGSALTSAKLVMVSATQITTNLTAAQKLLNTAIIGLKSPLGIIITTLGVLTLAFKDVDGVGQVLKATLTGLVAGFLAFKTVSVIQSLITGITTALSAQTVATNIATVSTTALNTALYANPIGLVVAGITALTAGLVVLYKSFTKASDGAKEYNKETEKIISNVDKINNNIIENKQAFEDTTKAIQSQTEANKMLFKEIENLVNLENLDNGQKFLLKQKIDELNASVEGLSLSYSEETGQLNMNSEAIEKQIKVHESQISLSSALEEQTRIRQDLALATQANEEAMARLAEVTMKLNEDEKLSYGDRKLLLEQQDTLKKSIEDTNNTIKDLNYSYDSIGETIEENAAIVDEANKLKSESEKEYQEVLKETGYITDMVATLDEESKERAKKILEDFTTYATNAFSKINKEASLSVNELVDNITENTNIIEQWTNDLAVLMERGVDEAFIQTLQEAGPEMANTVRNLVNASDEEIKKLNNAFTEGSEVAISGMRKIMGLPENIKTGSDMIDNIAENMQQNKNLDKASQEAIKSAKSTMDSQVDKSNFSTIGEDICNGIVSGIKNNSYIVENAIKSVAESSKKAFQNSLDIHSPSRVFISLSKFINEGIAQGLKDSSGLPIDEMSKISKAIIDSGNEISTGLIEIDKESGQLIYDNTYTNVMKKIDLFEKEKEKRLNLLDKGTDATLMAIDKELEATQNAYDIKLKLLEQEYLAKTSLIDEESARQIALINAQIDAINAQKEAERKAEEEERYKKEYEEKLSLLQKTKENTEEYYKAKEQLEELVRRREKELLNQKREEEKEHLKNQIEEIKSKASEEKENIKSVYEENKWKLEQQKEDELKHLKEMQEHLNNDFQIRKELEEVQTKLKSNENKKRTSNEIQELKRRETELTKSLKNNEIQFNNFGSTLSNISKGYGDVLLLGFTSTENSISEYIERMCDKLRSSINDVSNSFNNGIDGSHRTGLRSVPFDDYKAILHKGEMVLTQPEADRYRQGVLSTNNNAQITLNFYNVKEERTAFQVKREVKNTIRNLGLEVK